MITQNAGSACLPLLLFLGLVGPAAATAPQAVERDVPYVPTPEPVVEKMLELAGVKSDDYVIDLGCGDGRILVTAAKKYGVRGFGVDIDPQRIKESKANAEAAGVADRIDFRIENLFTSDIKQASVMTMYLLPQVNLDLRPKILSDLRPGSRIVSHDFDMGEWQPDQRVTLEKVKSWGGDSNVYLWIVPARVDGAWTVQQKASNADRRFTVSLKQRFQELEGTANIDGRSVPIKEARVNGETITFALDDGSGSQKFSGRVTGDRIEGSSGGAWSATKSPQ